MKKRQITLTESQLHEVINKAVRKVLAEADIAAGNNYNKEVVDAENEFGGYEEEIGKSEDENSTAPDFVLMMADRLEKKINQAYPNAVRIVGYVNNHNKNIYSYHGEFKDNHHDVKFDVAINHQQEANTKQIKRYIGKVAYTMFGYLDNENISVEYNYHGAEITITMDDNGLFKNNPPRQIPRGDTRCYPF